MAKLKHDLNQGGGLGDLKAAPVDSAAGLSNGEMGSAATGIITGSRLALVAVAGLLPSCVHQAEVSSYRKDAQGHITYQSEIVGARAKTGLLADASFEFTNMSVEQQKAHLTQQINRSINNALRHIGRDDCVNTFVAKCPNVTGDNWVASGIKVNSPSLTKWLVDKGIQGFQAAAFWKFANADFSTSINNSSYSSSSSRSSAQGGNGYGYGGQGGQGGQGGNGYGGQGGNGYGGNGGNSNSCNAPASCKAQNSCTGPNGCSGTP